MPDLLSGRWQSDKKWQVDHWFQLHCQRCTVSPRLLSSFLSFSPLLPFKRSVSNCVCVYFQNSVYCPNNLGQKKVLCSRITALFKRVKISSNKNAVFIIIQPSTVRVKNIIYTAGHISLRPNWDLKSYFSLTINSKFKDLLWWEMNKKDLVFWHILLITIMFICTHDQKFLFPMKHNMFFGSFLNYAR